MTSPTVAERRQKLITDLPTPTLTHALALVESGHIARAGLGATAEETRMVRAWICDEIEARYPAVTPIMEAWVEDDDDDRSYGQVLLDALATL